MRKPELICLLLKFQHKSSIIHGRKTSRKEAQELKQQKHQEFKLQHRVGMKPFTVSLSIEQKQGDISYIILC